MFGNTISTASHLIDTIFAPPKKRRYSVSKEGRAISHKIRSFSLPLQNPTPRLLDYLRTFHSSFPLRNMWSNGRSLVSCTFLCIPERPFFPAWKLVTSLRDIEYVSSLENTATERDQLALLASAFSCPLMRA